MEEENNKIEDIKEQIIPILKEEFYNKERAVNNILEKFKNEHPEIPWREISGIRNVLIHEYFGVNMKRVKPSFDCLTVSTRTNPRFGRKRHYDFCPGVKNRA